MKIIITCGGKGQRFVNAGYKDPKPLINVNGEKIIEYICQMFDKEDEMIFICNETHLATTNIKQEFESIRPNSKILSVADHNKGPAWTIMQTDYNSYINDEEEVIITYCDNPYLWDYESFKGWLDHVKPDGCILSHTGFHPHRLASTYMAYMKTDVLRVLEVQEKQPYTDNHWEEQASTGTYYFRRGSDVKKYLQQAIDENVNYNGEHYITLVYNLLIRDRLKVFCYPTDHVAVFGTPEEVQNFEAWQTILKGLQVKNEKDLVKCYRYWKEFNEQREALKK